MLTEKYCDLFPNFQLNLIVSKRYVKSLITYVSRSHKKGMLTEKYCDSFPNFQLNLIVSKRYVKSLITYVSKSHNIYIHAYRNITYYGF